MTTNPNDWDNAHQGRLTALIELSHQAGRRTLDFFGDLTLAVDRKGDQSPVTEADRSAERLIRQELETSYGDDAILGEEFEDTAGKTGYRWIVDPIDGTKSFICGVPLYSTLVGLEHEGVMLAGAIVIPALRESIVAASGLGAWHRRDDDQPWQVARVSKRESLESSVFVTSQVDSFAEHAAAFDEIQSLASITRTWGDAYGYLLVATGRADIMVDPVVSAWDVAAVLPVIAEAGGKFTDWTGESTIRGGNGVGSNGCLHARVLEILRR